MYILLRKHMWLLSFCIGHIVDMRLMDLCLYIFLTHVDALLWYYYASLLLCCGMYCYTVCVFLDMIMHYVMVVCFLYAIVDVPI